MSLSFLLSPLADLSRLLPISPSRPPRFLLLPPAMSAAPATRKLRVLCLHGFFQSSPVFRMKTAGLRRALKTCADLDYLQAPHALSDADQFKGKTELGIPEDTHFAWWKFQQPANASGSAASSSAPQRYLGWEASLAHLRAHVAAHGSYDAYLGFSQGAAFLTLVAALANLQKQAPQKMREIAAKSGEAPQDLSFFLQTPAASASDATQDPLADAAAASSSSSSGSASGPLLVFVSGFIPRVAHLKQFFPRPLAPSSAASSAAAAAAAAVPVAAGSSSLATPDPFAFDPDVPLLSFPSLHIYGLGDADVSPLESDTLSRAFNAPNISTHPGGHLVPNSAEFCRVYKQFLGRE